MELNKIYNEDCLIGMSEIEDVSIDALITDPPYNIARDNNFKTIMRVPMKWVKVNNRSGQIQVSPSILMQGLNTTINPTIYPILSNPYGMAPTPFQQIEVSPQMLGVTSVVGMMPYLSLRARLAFVDA